MDCSFNFSVCLKFPKSKNKHLRGNDSLKRSPLTLYPLRFFWAFLWQGMGAFSIFVLVTRAPSSGFTQISRLWTHHPTRLPQVYASSPSWVLRKFALPGSFVMNDHCLEGPRGRGGGVDRKARAWPPFLKPLLSLPLTH